MRWHVVLNVLKNVSTTSTTSQYNVCKNIYCNAFPLIVFAHDDNDTLL